MKSKCNRIKKDIIKRPLIPLFCCLLVVISLSTLIHAEINQVSIDKADKDSTRSSTLIVPTEYPTIGSAIYAASPGDTISVLPGIYFENLEIYKQVHLIGSGYETTIIDGDQEDNVIETYADGITISGFTIQNSGDRWNASGVCLRSDYNVISDNLFRYHFEYAGVLPEYHEHNVICNNIFRENLWGCYVQFCAYTEVYDNVFTENEFVGLGVWGSDFGKIYRNEMSLQSRGMYCGYCEENEYYNNYAHDNNVGMYNELSNLNNLFYENDIERNGVGLYFTQNSNGNTIYHNNFIGNTLHAKDRCNNIWNLDYPRGGNYWDNWTSPDFDLDGFVDIPYSMPTIGNQDKYPLVHPFVLGDMDVNGQVDFEDINPFVLALSSPEAYRTQFHMYPIVHGDINRDHELNFSDINPFVSLLSG